MASRVTRSGPTPPDGPMPSAAIATRLEATLDRALSDKALPGETIRPARLLDAMRYATLGGGKRLRPILLAESARTCGRDVDDGVLIAGAALECVHVYSLIHDDLPAMDDDDLRRGRLTVHRAFDEATAILAGDALLTLAFDLIGDTQVHRDPAIILAVTRGLARAAGLGGMAGGQMLDLEGSNGASAPADIVRMQSMKTGALIRFACEAGARLADASDTVRERIIEFGSIIGVAFQFVDDLIDALGNAETAGKATGKDAALGKATLVVAHGVNATRAHIETLLDEARSKLAPLGPRAKPLLDIAEFIVRRNF